MPKPYQSLLCALTICGWLAMPALDASAQPVIANVPDDAVASPSAGTSTRDRSPAQQADPADEDDEQTAAPEASQADEEKAPAEPTDAATNVKPGDEDPPSKDKAETKEPEPAAEEQKATDNKADPDDAAPTGNADKPASHASLDKEPEAPKVTAPKKEEAASKPESSEPASPDAAKAPATAHSDPATTPVDATAAVDPAPPPPNPVVSALLEKLETETKQKSKYNPADVEALKSFYSAPGREPIWLKGTAFNPRAKKAISEIRQADDWGLKASDYKLPLPPATTASDADLAAAEIKLSLAALEYARDAAGGRAKPSRVSRLFDQNPELPDPTKLMWSFSSNAKPDKLLRDQHPKHPQFEKLRQALLAERKASQEDAKSASSANKDKKTKTRRKSKASIHRLIANMERWRWLPRDLGDFYVWDDVPEQTTSVIDHGKVVLKEKIVVGKPSTPTPIFSDKMELIIFHPSWGVPPGMKRNELLPQLRNTGGGWFSSKPLASSVLRSHGLHVTRGGVRINPDSIDWTTANINNYHFTQPPGSTNVLGIVKFRFPNRHNVYMHDTPERHLFGKSDRTFSHGCMRVQNPVHLAEVLLAHDKGWSKGQVQSAKRRGSSIKLTNPIPVHIAYVTVHIDDEGKQDIRRDIYGLDSKVISAIEGRRVRVGSSGIKTSKRKTQTRRVYRKKKKKKKRTVADWEFNPFRYGN